MGAKFAPPRGGFGRRLPPSQLISKTIRLRLALAFLRSGGGVQVFLAPFACPGKVAPALAVKMGGFALAPRGRAAPPSLRTGGLCVRPPAAKPLPPSLREKKTFESKKNMIV